MESKNDVDAVICKAEIETQMYRQTYGQPRGGRVNWEFDTDICTPLYIFYVYISVVCNSFKPPWQTVVRQSPLSMEFSKEEYWSELPFPSPGELPDPGIKSRSPALQGRFSPSEPPGKP